MTYYRSVMVYAKPATGTETLQYMVHPEGIVRKTSNGFSYSYLKTDHLGSTRVMLTANGNNLTADQTTDYYPFGLAHELGNLQLNKYLYGGKEVQDVSLNGSMLGMYDFHARFYNPLYGRWFNIDPALQMTNPYLYCGNSPMMYRDPDGRFFFTALTSMIPGLQFLAPFAAQLDYSWMAGGMTSVAQGGSFWKGAGKGLVGAGLSIGASGLTSSIGNWLGHGGGGVGTELLRAGAHGLIGGGMSALQGGSFGEGFGVSSISSLAGSGASALGMSGSDLSVGMGAVGGLAAWGFGGDPMGGFWQGFGIGMLNHGEGNDPIFLMDPVVVTATAPPFILRDGVPYVWTGSYYKKHDLRGLKSVYPEFEILALGRGIFNVLTRAVASTVTRGGATLTSAGLGSTGRATAANVTEQLAMKEIMSNPSAGKILIPKLSDPRWKGWAKMTNKNAHGVEIHYNALWENGRIIAVDDFKYIIK